MTDTERVPEAGPRSIEPLRDVRVIDLTRILAGPYATMILGDLGADVVKIERPGHGDDTRHWGPPFIGDTASYYTAVNRNKRSIAIDLKHEQGRELVFQLLGDADLLVSNFRPGVMDRLGLGQAQLAETFPGLIRCSITGHAPDDPRAQQPSFDLVIQAETGLMDLNGQADGPPTKVGISIADELAGLYLVQGVLAALYHRERTGEGRTVNVALNEEGQWRRFCMAIERPELIDDARFATNTVRVENRLRLEPMLESRLIECTRDHWVAALGEANVPCGLVRTTAEAIDAEIALDTGLVGDGGDGVRMVGSPIRIGGARAPFGRPSPALGQHTDEVLAELGLSAEQIAELRTRGVVA